MYDFEIKMIKKKSRTLELKALDKYFAIVGILVLGSFIVAFFNN